MPTERFRTVKIPETGALWRCPESALKVHGLDAHIVDDDQVAGENTSSAQPRKASARRPKTQDQESAEQAAVTEEE